MSKEKFQERVLGVANKLNAIGDKAYEMKQYISELEKYDKDVISKTAEIEKLEDEAEVLSKKPTILGSQSIAASGIGQSDVIGITKVINKWIEWSSKNKDSDNRKIVGDALWQVWLEFQKNSIIAGTTFKKVNYPTWSSFLYRLLNAGILNQTSVSYAWTDYEKKLFEIENLESKLDASQLRYDELYKAATDLKNKGGYGLSDLKLDAYDNRKARKERRAKRKKARNERRDARKEVNSLIWNLEKKLNPAERIIVADYEKALISMEAITKRNQESEKAKFIEVGKVAETKEVELANIHVLIDAKENALATLGDLYDFAERKEAKYKRKDARKDYRSKKKALKDQYKAEYGKGWKKEAGWKDIKTDLLGVKQDVINEYAGLGTKVVKGIKAGVLYQAPLSGFHLLLVSNAFDIAGRMLRTKQNNQLQWDRIKTIYQKFGGNKANLINLIEKHGRQKPVPRYGDPIGKLLYKKGEPTTKIKADGLLNADGMNATGWDDAAIVAAITAATPIVVQVVKAVDKGDNTQPNFTGDPATDAALKENELNANIDLIENSDLTDAQKQLAVTKLKSGVAIQDAIEQVGGVDYSEGKSYWIVGTAAALLIGTALYFMFKKK